MRLFGRRRDQQPAPAAAAAAEPSRFTTAAGASGLTPATDAVFSSQMHDLVRSALHVLHGQAPYRINDGNQFARYQANFHDVFRGDRDGRTVIVANASENILPGLPGARGIRKISVCAVEIPALISLACVQPRKMFQLVRHVPERPTGDTAFDERFVVLASPGLPPVDVTEDMRRLIGSRDDWLFLVDGTQFACAGTEPFGSVDDMLRRIDEVLAVVAALPASVVPTRVDRSQDDLVARIAKLDTVEDALAFLQQLTAADREELAHSDTPLARFADVTTPEEAIARFESLDMPARLQLLAMFQRVEGAGGAA